MSHMMGHVMSHMMSHPMSHVMSHMISVIAWRIPTWVRLAHDQKLFHQGEDDEAEAAAAERRSHLQMCDYNMRVQLS